MLHQFRRIVCASCGHPIDVPVFCGFRFCPVCSVTRAIRVRRRLDFLVKNQSFVPGTFTAFLTLTIANQPNLPVMILKLQKAFKKLRNRAYWKSHVVGGAFVIEITGHPGNWHAHIHAILQTRWLDWSTLRNAWHKCSGSIGVFIKKIPSSAAVGYISKYVTKNDAPESVLYQISDGLKGIRLFAPIGAWFKLNLIYRRATSPCPNCGASKWTDYAAMCGDFHNATFKHFDVPAPPEDPLKDEPDYFNLTVPELESTS